MKGQQREARAAELRSMGWTYQRIADELGYAGATSAAKAVERALARVTAPAVEKLRASQQALLDEMKRTAVEVMKREHMAHSNGRVVVDLDSGEAVLDDGPKLDAIKTLVQVLTREAKVWGSDSQVKVEQEASGEVRIVIAGIDPDKL